MLVHLHGKQTIQRTITQKETTVIQRRLWTREKQTLRVADRRISQFATRMKSVMGKSPADKPVTQVPIIANRIADDVKKGIAHRKGSNLYLDSGPELPLVRAFPLVYRMRREDC